MLQIDASTESRLRNKKLIASIGVGRANLILRKEMQDQIKEARSKCRFQYVRFHGILHDDMAVYRNDYGNGKYNFQLIDEVMDFLISINMKPIVEWGLMPMDLASGQKTVFWEKMNITPPKDYDIWHDLIRSITKHWTERYGSDELKTWYFEVWNEPNHSGFFSGSKEEYFLLYEKTAKAVKSVNKQYQIGGPATAGLDIQWMEDMIRFCYDNDVPFDFISTHKYGANIGAFTGDADPDDVVIDKNVIIEDAEVLDHIVSGSKMPDLKKFFTEWGSSYLLPDPHHDDYHLTSFVLDTLKRVEDKAHMMSYWTVSDIFEEGGPPMNEFHGGFGLQTLHGIKKPVWYAFEYLSQLGQYIIEENENYFICKDSSENIQILYWDFTFRNQRASCKMYGENIIPLEIPPVEMKLTGLKNGLYKLDLFRTGYYSNNPVKLYRDKGWEGSLLPEDMEMLRSISGGSAEKSLREDVIDHSLCISFPLHENDVVLITLTREEE